MLDGYVLYLRSDPSRPHGPLRKRARAISRKALPLIQEMDVMASGTYLTMGADIARVRGERAVERQLIERAIERARASGLSNFVAFDVAEALFGAWFAGEAAAFAAHALELEETVERFGVRGFAYLASAARGRPSEPSELDIPKYVVFARLIAVSQASEAGEASRLARSALTVAQQYHSPFVEALAAIAAALSDDLSFDQYMAIAESAAERCDGTAFKDAVRAIAAKKTDAGMLDAYVANLSRPRARKAPPIEVDVIAGRVTVDGKALALSGRELELLIALALRREAVPRVKLAAMLWAELDEYAARNALSVCLHRLRHHLGREDAIVREADGYRLHGEAVVDLWEIDRVTSAVRAREALGEADRGALRRVWSHLREDRPSRMQRWEWFEPTERRLGEMRIEVAQRLANDALERDDPHAALEFAGDMIAYDGCDEPAREIAIRAYIALGDRPAALRQFRQYRDTLFAELQCEPSPSLTALVRA